MQMTVKDVIELLSKYPEDTIVVIDGGDWGGAVTRIDQDEYNLERNQVELHCDE